MGFCAYLQKFNYHIHSVYLDTKSSYVLQNAVTVAILYKQLEDILEGILGKSDIVQTYHSYFPNTKILQGTKHWTSQQEKKKHLKSRPTWYTWWVSDLDPRRKADGIQTLIRLPEWRVKLKINHPKSYWNLNADYFMSLK